MPHTSDQPSAAHIHDSLVDKFSIALIEYSKSPDMRPDLHKLTDGEILITALNDTPDVARGALKESFQAFYKGKNLEQVYQGITFFCDLLSGFETFSQYSDLQPLRKMLAKSVSDWTDARIEEGFAIEDLYKDESYKRILLYVVAAINYSPILRDPMPETAVKELVGMLQQIAEGTFKDEK